MEGVFSCLFLSVPGEEVRLGTKGIITLSASDFHQDQKDRLSNQHRVALAGDRASPGAPVLCCDFPSYLYHIPR